MATLRQPGVEPIPGYRLLEPLGKGGFGEVWKCEAPGGLYKAIKFVFGAGAKLSRECGAEQELRALRHVRGIRHPYLLSMDRIERNGDDLLIVMELADRSLHDQFAACRAAGLPGVPRPALLRVFHEAAEVLDLLNLEHGLQHLDVKPRNLLLVRQHVKLADFGLVRRLPDAARRPSPVGPISPVYAAPELFLGGLSRCSDQYSLAVTWCEMLTGVLPFDGKNFRQLAVQHAQHEPDLSRLAANDGPAVARALAKDPAARWTSCVEFVRALERAGPSESQPTVVPGRENEVVPSPSGATRASNGETPRRDPLGGAVQDTRAESGSVVRAATSLPAELAAYRLQACRQRGPLAEVWTAETAGGACTITLLTKPAELAPAAWQAALQQLARVEGSWLVPVRVLSDDPGRTTLASPQRGPTLREHYSRCREGGRAGVPRAELLALLRAAAETLDGLRQAGGPQHLALDPDRLQLVGGRLLVADFGLAAFLWRPAGHVLARGNPRYAAPELWNSEVDGPCDSYSLALIYQEMLTGRHPLAGEAAADGGGAGAAPNLELLPPGDRAILARALDRAPSTRFGACTELIAALEAAGTPMQPDEPLCAAERILQEVVAGVAGKWQVREYGPFNFLLLPGSCLRHTCVVRPPAAPATAVRDALGAAHAVCLGAVADDAFRCRVSLPSEGWQRFMGGASGLEVHLRLLRRPTLPPDLCEAHVEVRPFGRDGPRGARQRNLEEWGPQLVEVVRAALSAQPERRLEDRFGFCATVAVAPLLAGNAATATVPAQVKDLSRGGISLYLRRRPEDRELNVFFALGDGSPALPVPIRVVRVQPLGDGYEVGALFLTGDFA